ncbi:MAG: type IX secretion system sortase PorU [Flavobacteriales bacterium]|jgi:mRNA-degrading endonuclease RelE of RelBE toxin-antitoxin system|nr:type IX secretion system sortase PorU [Flavobacteriales bacterium]
MLYLKKILFSFFLAFSCLAFAQTEESAFSIHWQTNGFIDINNYNDTVIYHKNASHYLRKTPYFTHKIELKKGQNVENVTFEILETKNLLPNEKKLISTRENFKLKWQTGYQNQQSYLFVSFPGIFEEQKISEIKFHIHFKKNRLFTKKVATWNYPNNSPLKDGSVYKIAASRKGVYKITGTKLQSAGIDLNTIEPQKLKIYGNHQGMLNEFLTPELPFGLEEMAIEVVDGNDNSFDANDYVLFYSNGLHDWKFDTTSNYYTYENHFYDTTAYYFLKFEGVDGKRIPKSNFQNSNTTLSEYDFLYAHENELYNPKHSGRKWLGERLEAVSKLSFDVGNNNRTTNTPVRINLHGLARSNGETTIDLLENGAVKMSLGISKNLDDSGEGVYRFKTENVILNNNKLSFDIAYDKKGQVGAIAYLDKISLEFKEQLQYYNKQFTFSNKDQRQIANGVNYQVLGNNYRIWQISDQNNIQDLEIQNQKIFSGSNKLQSFAVFNNSNTYSIEAIQEIPNQNLHQIEQTDYVVIYHPNWKDQAIDLVNYRKETHNYNGVAVNVFDIYNEFSSGTKDPTALRNFIHMLYVRNKTSKTLPKGILFFGDASYDFKSIHGFQSDFVPTYISNPNYFTVKVTDATDDYFALLDDNDGGALSTVNNFIDIPIGRLIVRNKQEAQDAVRKIKRYEAKENQGEWQTKVALVADDVDQNENWERLLALGADQAIEKYQQKNPGINVNKIYADAYKQINSVGGQRYPDVENEIQKAVDGGALIVHYYGHGGEKGWASERILNIDDINSWTNEKELPLFITTTCEFTRYDDPNRVSAGEYVALNPNGGAIALLTTTRAIGIGDAENLSRVFYNHLGKIDTTVGKQYTVGELLYQIKNGTTKHNRRRFILIGDPAVRLKFPKNKMRLTKINNQDISNASADTIKALEKVSLEGILTDINDNKIIQNGIASITVFDKRQTEKTLRNDNLNVPPVNFLTQKNIIFKGNAPIKNGDFKISFVVPKDINLDMGKGKVQLFAKLSDEEAFGYDTTAYVGGVNPNPAEDNEGPDISLFMNDSTFIDGGMVTHNSAIFAQLFDENGINTVGLGIGHDITAIIDEQSAKPIILNNFYEATNGDFRAGTVNYPLYNLENGLHTLSLKAWDTYNNSSKKTIEFQVVDDATSIITDLFNYPNPMQGNTHFSFQHNLYGQDIQVNLSIYDLQGRRVAEFSKDISDAPAVLNQEFSWNGTTSSGVELGSGMYLYRLSIQSSKSGISEYKTERLVLVR